MALDGLDSTAAVVIVYNDGNNKTETISKTELEALSSSNTKTITTQYGDLVLNGYSKTSDGTITVNYTYTLTQAPTVNGVDTNDSFTITAKDRNGDSDGPQTLNIKIVDDAPTAVNDTDSVRSGESKTGNVLSNDTAGADDWKKDASSNVAAVVDVINSSSTPATPDSNGNLVVSGTYGTLTLQPDGSYTYQANPDVIGTPTDVFTYTVEDADGDQTTAALTITINNSDLTLAPGTANVYEKHLADGTDPQTGGAVATGNLPLTSTGKGGHTLTNPALVGDNGGASKGTVVINGDGTYTYTLTNTENHSGTDPVTDTFTYQAQDQYGNTVTNTVTITIVDDAPEAVNDTVNLGNKHTISGNALQGDDNGVGTDKLGADGAKVTGLAKGNTTGTAITDDTGVAGAGVAGDYGTLILNADGSYTYTRTDTTVTSATDVFTYTITDADGDTSTATITINIYNKVPNTPTGPGVDTTTPPNEVDEAGLSEGSNPGVGNKVTGKITFTPGDGENTYAITTPPGFGDVVITGSTDNGDGTTTIEYEYTLTTPTDKSGDSEDKFTVTITDEDGDKVDAEVAITIKNDTPAAENDTNDVVEGQSITGNVITNDKPGADGWATNGPVTEVAGEAGGAVTSAGEGWLVETDKGTLTIQPDGSYSYTAKPNVGGDDVTDTFTYTVTDGDGDTTTATLTISISDNTPPEAKPDINEVPEDTPAKGNVLANDSDAEDDPLKVKDFTVNGNTYTPGSSVEIPGVGEITLNENGDYIFTPVPDWNGTVPTIEYTVTDGNGGEAQSTLNITVTPVQDAFDDTDSTHVNTPVTTEVLTNDSFSDPEAKITATTPPANGTVVVNDDGTITYTPNPGFTGTDTYTYTVSSGGVTETATVTIEVSNQPPAPVDDFVSTAEDTPISGNLLGNDSEPDNDPLTVTEISVAGFTTQVPTDGSSVTVDIPNVGSVTVNQAGDYTFTPVADWNGEVPPITYTVDDGTGSGNSSNTAKLNITVTPVQDAFNDTGSTHVNTPVTTEVLTNDSFSDPEAKITATTPPANGTVVVNDDGTITYTPNPGFTGTDTYTYTVSSGGVTETATVTIEVSNQPPAPVDDFVSTAEDTPISGNLLGNDSEPDNDPLTVTEISVAGVTTQVPTDGSSVTVDIPNVGSVTVNQAGDYTFTPVADWNGEVPPITYTVDDGTGSGNSSNTAKLNITVTPVQDIQDDTVSTPAGNPVNVPVLDNDRFSDPNAKVTGTTPPANGKVTINPDGTITYTPNPGFSGEDSFTYTVTTEGGVTETGTVTIVVHPENPPVPTPVPPTDNYQPPGSVGTDKGKDPVTGSPVITDPSVFYEGERWNDVRRLPIPLHPVLYVNNQVAESQLEREQADLHTTSSPELTRSYRMSAKSIGNGLGQDHNLFVSHAIRAAQGTASDLEDRVNSRLSRINLSADDLLSAPELRQADPNNMVADVLPEQPRWISQPVVDAEEIDSDKLDGELVTQSVPAGAAPSFTEQLRGGDKRLPMAALNKNLLTN